MSAEVLYTYTLYAGKEIADYIKNNPTSLLAEEFTRKYYTDIASDGWWLEPSFCMDKKYYITSYCVPFVYLIVDGERIVDQKLTYKIHRETCFYDNGKRKKEEIK